MADCLPRRLTQMQSHNVSSRFNSGELRQFIGASCWEITNAGCHRNSIQGLGRVCEVGLEAGLGFCIHCTKMLRGKWSKTFYFYHLLDFNWIFHQSYEIIKIHVAVQINSILRINNWIEWNV